MRDVLIVLFAMAIAFLIALHFTAGLLELIGLWPGAKPVAVAFGGAGGLAVLRLYVNLARKQTLNSKGKLNFDARPEPTDYAKLTLRQFLVPMLWFFPFATIALYGGDVVWKAPADRDSIVESLGSGLFMCVVLTAWFMIQRYRASERR